MQVTSTTKVPTAVAAAATTGTTSASSSSSTSSSSSSTTAAASASGTVDYNSFLKLLVAELQNQDPTNPTDPTQYLSQIASFSAVGQTVQTNSKLDTMLTTSALQQADTVIGRTVTSSDGSISGQVTSVSIGTGGTITATLATGSTLTLGSGVTIS